MLFSEWLLEQVEIDEDGTFSYTHHIGNVPAFYIEGRVTDGVLYISKAQKNNQVPEVAQMKRLMKPVLDIVLGELQKRGIVVQKIEADASPSFTRSLSRIYPKRVQLVPNSVKTNWGEKQSSIFVNLN